MNLSAADSFTDPILKQPKEGVGISVSGVFSGTVTIQRSRDGTTWRDWATTTGAKEFDFESYSAHYWRAGFKTGQFTSGTAEVEVY